MSVQLRENAGPASTPYRVDRDKGVIYGVKVIGRYSANTHGVAGVEGTEYTPEAQAKAKHLYEGRKVNVDHPPRDKPGKDRSSYDRIGKLIDFRQEGGQSYADLHMLKTHPLYERLMEAAEKMPDLFGLSHNAGGRGEVKGKKFIVHEIPYVRSVDIVADPGSVHSLFESKEPRKRAMKKRTLREALEKDLKLEPKEIKFLFEADGLGMDAAMGADESPEAPGEAAGYEEHLAQAVCAIFQDDALGIDEKKKKLVALLKVAHEEETKKETPESEEDGAKKDEGKKEEEEEVKDTKESLEQADRLRFLERKDAVRDLCESETFTPSKLQLEAMLAFDSDKKVKAFILEAKAAKAPPPPKKNAPRTGSHFVAVQESRSTDMPKDAKEFASALLS